MTITYKDAEGVRGMRVAGKLASEVLDFLTHHVQPGITTNALDKLAFDFITEVQGGIPAPLNYRGGGNVPYPKSICTSVNHQVCHGIPNDKPLKKGDIVNIDVTVIKDGWHGDTSRMFIVGDTSIAAKRLCSITYDAMWHGIKMVKPGVSTDELDRLAHDHIVNVQQAIPAPLNYAPSGYKPYPKSICTSINHQVCHGIPNDRPLKNGDILNIDVTVIKDGWHGDTSRMFIVGEGSIAAKRLCQMTYDAMWRGIAKVKPGAKLGDIGHSIQTFAETNGFSVVREFCGHGIGRNFHEEPQVLHYGRPGTLDELLPGMVFTIEPMINAGKRDIREMGDGWTIVTKDRSLSAQWEHTVLVTETGYEVLTLSAGSPAPPAFVAAAVTA